MQMSWMLLILLSIFPEPPEITATFSCFTSAHALAQLLIGVSTLRSYCFSSSPNHRPESVNFIDRAIERRYPRILTVHLPASLKAQKQVGDSCYQMLFTQPVIAKAVLPLLVVGLQLYASLLVVKLVPRTALSRDFWFKIFTRQPDRGSGRIWRTRAKFS